MSALAADIFKPQSLLTRVSKPAPAGCDAGVREGLPFVLSVQLGRGVSLGSKASAKSSRKPNCSAISPGHASR